MTLLDGMGLPVLVPRYKNGLTDSEKIQNQREGNHDDSLEIFILSRQDYSSRALATNLIKLIADIEAFHQSVINIIIPV